MRAVKQKIAFKIPAIHCPGLGSASELQLQLQNSGKEEEEEVKIDCASLLTNSAQPAAQTTHPKLSIPSV